MDAFRAYTVLGFLLASTAAGGPAAAGSQANDGPPTGAASTAVVDLSTITGAWPSAGQEYYMDFTSTGGEPTITFAFRDDRSKIQFYDVSLVDVTTSSSANLISNGDFSGGTSMSFSGWVPKNWDYENPDSVRLGGRVAESLATTTNPCVDGAYCWLDGAAGGYDQLSQQVTLNVNVGDKYELLFYATDPIAQLWRSISNVASPASAMSENAVDVVGYASNAILLSEGVIGPIVTAPPPSVPEPSTWLMMLFGFTALGYVGYRRCSSLVS